MYLCFVRTIFSYATYTTKKFIHTDFPVYIRTNEQEINEMLRPFIQLFKFKYFKFGRRSIYIGL